MKTLDEHIKQGEIYLKNKDIYAEYKKIKPRKQPKLYEAHCANLMMFEAAQRYFKEHYIKSVSLGAWKTEREELTAGRGKAYRDYNAFRTQFLKAALFTVPPSRLSVRSTRHRRGNRERGRWGDNSFAETSFESQTSKGILSAVRKFN